MAGLGFLGGLGMVAPSIQKGYDAGIERQRQAEDREFQLAQRQRTVDEQKRDDQYRQGMQDVQTTETLQNPASQTMYGKEAPVVRDDEGNLMPGAVETPAQAVTRQRNRDDVLMDYANIARKAGKLDQAFKFEADAEKASHDRAAALFQQWSASVPSDGDVVAAANQARQIYNNDRLPGRVENVQPDGKGGAVLTMFNKMSGQTMQLPIKNVEELKTKLEGYYSPETYNAYIKAKREAYLKAQEKGAEPYTLKPGEKRLVGNKEVATNDTGYVWTGEYNADGSAKMVKAGAGGKTGKAEKTNVQMAGELLEKAYGGKGDGSPEGAQRFTRAQSYLNGIYSTNPNVEPETASAIAADAAADPSKITMQIDNRTGQISKVYRNPDFKGGQQFNLGANAGTVAEMEKVVGKSGMADAVGGMIGEIASVVPAEQQPALRAQLIKAASDPEARKAVLAAAKDNGQDVAAMNRQLDLIKAYAVPAPAPQRTLNTNVGGMKQPTVDPNSAAGRSQARQSQMRAEADRKEADRMEAQKTLSKQFQADKVSMSAEDLARKYDANRGQLPVADAAELRRIESQAYRAGK